MSDRSLYIDGQWCAAGGDVFASLDPATQEPVWRGHAASIDDVNRAVAAAQSALDAWREQPLADRIAAVERYAQRLEDFRQPLAEMIARETGKPNWEAQQEVSQMAAKVALSLRAHAERRAEACFEVDGAQAALRYRSHGVVAVLGPFNLPGHLPGGHIIPALIAGNTVVFKPSEKTPGVGETMMRIWAQCELPDGVMNLVQGQRATGEHLTGHADIDGIYFTGGTEAGLAIQQAALTHPHKILALEMGGNNPLVVHEAADVRAAALLTIQSAYLTAGQRCTCARRLIVPEGEAGDTFVTQLVDAIGKVRVGRHDADPAPFMGPMISIDAAQKLLDAQKALQSDGGDVLVPAERVTERAAMVRPGLIDVTNVIQRPDVELFGPLLQLIRVRDFDAAIEEANRTRYGLVAALLSDRRDLYERFLKRVQAGVTNWNRPTNGASGALPFGGIGLSGNHRPAGYWSVDYCSYPIASLESDILRGPDKPMPGIDT